MTTTPQLFRVNADDKTSVAVQEVEFSELGLRERDDIQKWVAANPRILAQDLLVITEEFNEFDKTDERLDLLAVDSAGNLVVIELKRDDTGADVHWQAIKYASYLHRATPDEIVRMLAAYKRVSGDEATEQLRQHLGADDLEKLNTDQRIILASHRFAPEVTSAVLWLNERTASDLITCIQLTPYRDERTDCLYLQATTIIPVSGTEAYRIQIGSAGNAGIALRPHSRYNPHIDDVKRFLAGVEALAQKDLPENLRLDKSYRPTQWGYWMFWYSRDPWKRWSLAYLIQLQKTTDILSSRAAPLLSGDVLKEFHEDWVAEVSLVYKPNAGLSERVLKTIDNQQVDEAQIAVEARDFRKIAIRIGADELDDEFVKRAAESLRNFIDTITPAVDRAL